jgi:hypothetical protein
MKIGMYSKEFFFWLRDIHCLTDVVLIWEIIIDYF